MPRVEVLPCATYNTAAAANSSVLSALYSRSDPSFSLSDSRKIPDPLSSGDAVLTLPKKGPGRRKKVRLVDTYPTDSALYAYPSLPSSFSASASPSTSISTSTLTSTSTSFPDIRSWDTATAATPANITTPALSIPSGVYSTDSPAALSTHFTSASLSSPAKQLLTNTSALTSLSHPNPSGVTRSARTSISHASHASSYHPGFPVLPRHVVELLRDNHRIELIVLPTSVSNSRKRHGQTPGVRKIIQSQKTFANHLNDEEAILSHQTSLSSPVTYHYPHYPQLSTFGSGNTNGVSETRSSSIPLATTQFPGSSRYCDTDHVNLHCDDKYSFPRFVKPYCPPQILQVYLAAPPRSYLAARADPPNVHVSMNAVSLPSLSVPPSLPPPPSSPSSFASTNAIHVNSNPTANQPIKNHLSVVSDISSSPSSGFGTPCSNASDPLLSSMLINSTFPTLTSNIMLASSHQRFFCTLCGYWARTKCSRCAVRICSLTCWNLHAGSCITMIRGMQRPSSISLDKLHKRARI